MPLANSNTGNTGALNGSVYQYLRGLRTFVNLLGAPKAHENTEFVISSYYAVAMDKQYFTEATENEVTTKTHTDYQNLKNTFSFMKKAVEVSQTALNSSKHIADANVLAEVGANYYLTEVFEAQLMPALQAFSMEYNHELINSTYTEFSTSANSTRGLIEASKEYTDTNVVVESIDAAGMVKAFREILVKLAAEGVTLGKVPTLGTDAIEGTVAQRVKTIELKALAHPSTFMLIEDAFISAANPYFQISRSRTEAGSMLTTLMTSFGEIVFEYDEDMPLGEVVIARFGEMSPVFQPSNPIGREAGQTLSPSGAIIDMVKDMKRSQGIGVELFLRVGLDHGTPNRIGNISGIVTPPAKSAAPKGE